MSFPRRFRRQIHLDTNVYSALARGDEIAVAAIMASEVLVLLLPVIAELRYGFLKDSLANHNAAMPGKFLAQPDVSIAIPSIQTSAVYAELQLYCLQRGKVLPQNDLWIAALAQESSE